MADLTDASTPAQKLSLRLRLGLLVAGTTLPLILFAAGIIYLDHIRDRQVATNRVLENARSMQLVLDREIDGITRALEVLAGSNALQRGDMEGFRSNVEAFLRRYPEEASISLAERDGTQLLNSRVAAGLPLPRRANVQSIEEVFRTRHPAYSNLFIGSVTGWRLITVSVPVFNKDGEVIYELSFNPPLETFLRIIEQGAHGQSTVAIFDRTGTNFARVPNPEHTIGQKASPSLMPALLERNEGTLTTTSLEGVPLVTAFTRSPLTGWTVAAGTPVEAMTAPLWQALTITAGIGTIMLAIGLTFAVGMARRIARAEAVHGFLVNELNHRVKNTLATVQSIAMQTFREANDPAEARRKFDARLAALGQAHDALSDQKWASAEVGEIVEGVLAPFAAKDGTRLDVSGPPVSVGSRCALMLAMALHELATNAAKYGALSDHNGRIAVHWAPDDGAGPPMVRVTWRESDGPAVRVPERKGFGLRMIEEGFARQVGGAAEVKYDPAGFSCTLTCPRA